MSVKFILTSLIAGLTVLSSTAIQAMAQGGKSAAHSPMSRLPDAKAAQREALEGEAPRVFGGTEAAEGAWPFQVALLTSEGLDETSESQFDAQFCGGSLISPEWVLTAAHCLVDGETPVAPETVTVLVGATALNDGTRYSVEQVIVHAGYSQSTLDNDIALIKMSTKTNVPFINLVENDVQTGTATVTGWGRMDDGYFPVNLMQTDVELKPNESCNSGMKEIYKDDLARLLWDYSPRLRISGEDIETATAAIGATMGDPLTGNMLCAGVESGARDACNGDSGGPLFMVDGDKITQVGVVSWGDGPLDSDVACGHENAFGVYSRVSRYRDWIRDNTGV
ncbi:MAG: serine protease [Rhizobiaceae bacterium]